MTLSSVLFPNKYFFNLHFLTFFVTFSVQLVGWCLKGNGSNCSIAPNYQLKPNINLCAWLSVRGQKLLFRTESEEVMAVFFYFPGLVQCLGISSMCLVSEACIHLFWVKIMVCTCGFCLVFYCLTYLLFVQLIEFLLLSEILPVILTNSPGY